MGDWFTQNAPPTAEEAQMLAQIRARESSGDYSARNPKPGSTAAGAYQFTSSPVSPTWQLANKATGVPVYPSADKAPRAIQDANALYMLRKHGPDATITWAASGPYGQAGDGASAAPSKDGISRILAGEDIELTPDVINEIVSGKLPGSSAESAPVQPSPPPVASGPVQAGDWFAQNAPPPKSAAPQDSQPGVVERFKKQYTQQTGINDLLDIIRASNRYGTPQEVAARGEKAQTALGHLVTGLRDEPARIWGEIAGIGQSMLDPKQNTADMSMHMLGVVPMLGPALQGFVHDVWAKKYPEAAADLAALRTLTKAPRMIEAAGGAIEALPEAAQTARAAVSGAVKGGWEGGTGPTVLPIKVKGVQVAEIPGVPASIAGAVTGGGAGTLFGGPKLGIAGAVTGAAIPIVKGAVKGARSALADLEAARAAGATEAFPVPAEPAPGPITGPTDEALVHLYSVETDAAKRAALEAQLVDRGLMNKPAAPVTPPEANPYRDYSQDALRKVYAIEPDPAKLALIEQAARNRGLSLLSREGRRATAAVPETGTAEVRGPSLTSDDALMLRYLGETDPLAADAETIGIARKLAVDNPELLRRLRAGETEPIVAPPTPAEKTMTAQPAVQSVPAAMEYNAPSITPAQERIVKGAQQAGEFTPEETARAAAILENVEPQAAPAAQPPATAPAAAPKPAAAELAQQFEATTRPDRMLDFLKRMDPEISAAAIDNLDPNQWELVARGAGSPAGTIPTPEDIAAVRGNLAQSEGASQITAKTPGEAKAQFEQNRETRTVSNRAAMATRFRDALMKEGISADDVAKIEPGYVSNKQITELRMRPRWGNIAEHLGEKEPSAQTVAEIVRQMREEGPQTLRTMMEGEKPATAAPQWHHGSKTVFQELDPELSHPGSEHGKVSYITDNPKEAAKYGTVRSVEFTGKIFPEESALDLKLLKRVTQQLSKDNPKQASSITARLESAKTRGIKTNDIALQEIRQVLPGDFVAQQQAINNALKKLGYSARAYTEESGAKTLAVFDKQALRSR